MAAMTESLEREDFARALNDTDDWLGTHPDADTLALIYNCRTWIRWGSGDRKGALDENEQLPRVVASAAEDVKRGALLHYWWDKSYLLAEAGRAGEAEKARAEFFQLGDRPDDEDSRNTLVAFLRAMAGDGKGAREAAEQVDLARDGDLQDAYVVQRAIAAGGDQAKAAAIREQIRSGPRYPMKPLILQQLKRDGVSAAP
jgi:hypothetical protein